MRMKTKDLLKILGKRGDDMFWLAAKLNIDRKLTVLAACDCAELSAHLADDDRRSRTAQASCGSGSRGP